MQFDATTFEALEGAQVGYYAIDLMRCGIREDDLLPYFKRKAAALDVCHLETAIVMLGKVGTDAAYREVTRFLEYPDFSVRFAAVKVIAGMPRVESSVMRCVGESLTKHAGDSTDLAQELKVALERPADADAKAIASQYRKKLNAK